MGGIVPGEMFQTFAKLQSADGIYIFINLHIYATAIIKEEEAIHLREKSI